MTQILEILQNIGVFLVNLVSGLVQLVSMIPQALSMITSSIAMMPPVLTAYATAFVLVSVVYLVIGR